MIYPYNGILLSNKKGINDDTGITYYNVDEPWKHCGEWKNPVLNEHILNDPIYRNVQSRQIHRDRKSISAFRELGGEEEWGVTVHECRVFFSGWF